MAEFLSDEFVRQMVKLLYVGHIMLLFLIGCCCTCRYVGKLENKLKITVHRVCLNLLLLSLNQPF